MIQSAITVSLVDEARGGPFVYWDDLNICCREAKELGFDAIELFAPSPTTVPANDLQQRLREFDLKLAAVGTGAGWVKHRLTLTSADPEVRRQARDFIRSMIQYGAPFQAPAIIGSMQGQSTAEVDHSTALEFLADAFDELGEYAATEGVPLIYEPLNRYETNLINTIADGVEFLKSRNLKNVKLLADLFHMNIEETNVADAIRAGQDHIGHIHFVDSNRRAAGHGHTDFALIATAVREVEYVGYLSAEAFPYPDSRSAARSTIELFRRLFV